jgi:hypothetical protein
MIPFHIAIINMVNLYLTFAMVKYVTPPIKHDKIDSRIERAGLLLNIYP